MKEIRLVRVAAQEVARTVTSISLMVYCHQRDVKTFARLYYFLVTRILMLGAVIGAVIKTV